MSTTTNFYLLPGARGTISDMHVQSGYPIWNLAASWIAANYDDAAVIAEYQLDPAEWAAAKDYYLQYKAVFDARIIINQQPTDDAANVPPLRSPEEFFAWAARARGLGA
jgi:hypothetical protein